MLKSKNMKAKILTLSLIAFLFTLSVNTQAQSTAGHHPNEPIAQHYEGGLEKLNADIQAAIVYPMMAKRSRKQGTCVIKLKLHADGTASTYEIVKNIGLGCGKEALRVVKTLKFNAPGFDQDYKVAVKFTY